MGFDTIDLVIVCVYLVGVTVLGSLAGRRLSSTQDYFLAGRRAPWWLVCMSVVATETSTLTFVAVPAMAFAGDLVFMQVVAGYVVGRMLVAWVFVPAYMKGGLQTSYELLQGRLGGTARRATAGIFCITRLLGDGVRLFSACVVMKEVLPLLLGPGENNELIAVGVVGGLTLVYTFLGGMRAVLWTDLIQLCLYLGGGGLAMWFALKGVPGGLDGVLEQAEAAGKLRFMDTDPAHIFSHYSLVGGLVGGVLVSMASHGTDQLIVQRLLSCRSTLSARTAMVGSGIVVFAQMAFFLLLGLVLWAFYQLKEGEAPSGKEALAHFLVTELPTGMAGPIVAAAFAAAMSTLSGSLNSLASSTINDFYRPLSGGILGDRHYLQAGRFATLVWGLALMAVAVPIRGEEELLDLAMAIAGITAGGVLGLFLLSRYKIRGAVIGMFAGTVVSAALWVDTNLMAEKVVGLHWTWLCPVGLVVCLVTAGVVDILTGGKK